MQTRRLVGGENTNNQTDETVSDDDVQDITSMTSKPIDFPSVKRILIPPTAQTKFISLYNISGITDWEIFINYRVESLLTPDRETFNTKS